jgi:rhamnogalacturonan endolyase
MGRFVSMSASILLLSVVAAPVFGQRQMENVSRRVIAVHQSTTQVYVGWRLFATDSPSIAFNLYRSTDGGAAVKLNATPLTATTDYVDTSFTATLSNAYFVRPVLHGQELAASPAYTLPANSPVQQYISIPLQVPPTPAHSSCGGTTSGGSYTANDGTVADLDGDGEYEYIVKWDPSDSRDNASTGCSSPQILDAYKLDGTRLWRINLGPNIRSGAHYTQFMVYDLDGDGMAEVVMKTADGTIDGLGHVIGSSTALWVDTVSTSPTFGKVETGPEYLTIFNGTTGAAMDTVNYDPPRGNANAWNGPGGNCGHDNSGNRVDRFLAGVAYLDGVHPSAVMARGYYGRSTMAAWDWKNGHLTEHWFYDSGLGAVLNPDGTWAYNITTNLFTGEGDHYMTVADVDNDGKDDIVYGSMVVNSDGTGRYGTGLWHGDAMHVSRFSPDPHSDLMFYGVHEHAAVCPGTTPGYGTDLHNARTGAIIVGTNLGVLNDYGRGMIAVLDPLSSMAYMWGGTGLVGIDGNTFSSNTPASTNFGIWWDADLARELEDGTSVTKYNVNTHATTTLLSASGVTSNNGTKSDPVLTADIFGDWREEVIYRTSSSPIALRIYISTIPAANRLPTLMQDPEYRLAVTNQNVAYNQPPWPSFYIGPGMATPPAPNIVTQASAGVALDAAIAAKSGALNNRVWTLSVTNAGPGIAESVWINSVTFAQTYGSACTPAVLPRVPAYPPAFPIVVGDLDQNTTGAGNINIDFTGCATTARFTVTVGLSANAGRATSVVRTNQFY